jgi:ATP-dependent protease ClpP protease subunit
MKTSFLNSKTSSPFSFRKLIVTALLTICCSITLRADGPVKEKNETEREEVAITEVEDLRPLLEGLLLDKKSKLFTGQLSDEIVVIHLRGKFDTPKLSAIGEIITFGEYQLMMDIARSREPKAIVLAIDSPGGLVYTCDQIVDSLIEVQSEPHNEKIVAWVEFGGSAAALTALACKTIIMRPNGRMGSATAAFENGTAVPDPLTAIENKMQAMEDARSRQISDVTGRPIEIQLAMQEPQHEFWFHPKNGFSLTTPDGQMISEWKSFDSSKEKPLALSSQELEEIGVSEGTAGSTQKLLDVLGLRADTSVTNIDLMDPKLQEILKPAREKMLKQVAEYYKQLNAYEKRSAKFLKGCYEAAVELSKIQDGAFMHELTLVQAKIVTVDINKLRVPVIQTKLRQLMQKYEPGRLNLENKGLRNAKAATGVAQNLMKRSIVMKSINKTEIFRNLSLAYGYAFQGHKGRPYAPVKNAPVKANVNEVPRANMGRVANAKPNVAPQGQMANDQLINGQVQIKDEVAGPLHVVNGGQLRLMGVCKGESCC